MLLKMKSRFLIKELIIIKILVSAEHFILTDRNEIVVQIFILSFQ